LIEPESVGASVLEARKEQITEEGGLKTKSKKASNAGALSS